MIFRLIPCAVLAGTVLAALPVHAQQKGPDALSRVFKHRNGNVTETQKMGGVNEIREAMYDKNKVLIAARTFSLDAQGRILNSVIYDGKRNPVASTRNNFDQQSGRMTYEEMFDRQGRLVRMLYYPGATNLPANAKNIVAFSIKPDGKNPKAAAVATPIAGTVTPVTPVTRDEDDFEVGVPQGAAAPTLQELNRSRTEPATTRRTGSRTFLRQKKP